MTVREDSNHNRVYVLIASVPASAAASAMDALRKAGIPFGGRLGRGVFGIRVTKPDIAQAQEVLKADSLAAD